MSSLISYIYLKLVALIIRTLAKFHGPITSSPDAVCYIPSRDLQRTIKVHIYQSLSHSQEPRPVLVNFHGSGFMIPAHGSDDAFCHLVSRRTGYTILDVQYRLAPEHPFPAALHDVEDVVEWVQSQPKVFDLTRLAISGFSAGGNLALTTAATKFPPGTFHAVLSFYPCVDAFCDPYAVAAPEAGGQPIPPLILQLFRDSYLQGKVEPRDPRVCPSFADPDRFPAKVLIITAGYDNLANEAEQLAAKLADHPTRQVVSKRMDGCDHGWDKMARWGTHEWELRDRAYDLAVQLLQS
ncbi:Alpha/Beta hydrolase protein [Aspergillus avenaceus]|uniref:Alpha/Beta hydrolase protein n=1 Tax=Aspergillus avenaceus TaxID=36643 RepID=A0A5N6TLD7_ASPAV|nr:Alpha/Beta hydrolase protein [Aspergillus avenaceus]